MRRIDFGLVSGWFAREHVKPNTSNDMEAQEQNTSNDIFSENLRQSLFSKGWTQAQLGDACGLTQGVVSNYLRGKREPSSGQLLRISRALGVSMEHLLTGKGPAPLAPVESGNLKDAKETAKKLVRQLEEAEETARKLRGFLG